jgi:pyruvate-formate lyase-activating enzyme
MQLLGLHLLLTYQCTLECDHCFVWGSPWQSGTLTLRQVRQILQQATELGTVEWVYFEGGEPFLYYAVLLKAVQEAARLGFRVGVVSNSYWANDLQDALEWLRPFAGIIQDVSISSDVYHWNEKLSRQAQNALGGGTVGHPVSLLSVAQPGLGG